MCCKLSCWVAELLSSPSSYLLRLAAPVHNNPPPQFSAVTDLRLVMCAFKRTWGTRFNTLLTIQLGKSLGTAKSVLGRRACSTYESWMFKGCIAQQQHLTHPLATNKHLPGTKISELHITYLELQQRPCNDSVLAYALTITTVCISPMFKGFAILIWIKVMVNRAAIVELNLVSTVLWHVILELQLFEMTASTPLLLVLSFTLYCSPADR